MKIINFLKDLIAPKKCYFCKKEGYFLCKKCLEKIGFFSPICYVCKKKSLYFNICQNCKEKVFYDKIIILTHYQNEIISKLIKDSKFYYKKDILEDFGFYLGKKLFENISEKKEDLVLIPTPMYFLKKLFRGYNQSEILIKNISKFYNLDYDFNIIKKIKSTKPQSHLSKIERIENLKGVFKLNKEKIKKYKDKVFIIVDDVISTGTTINEISKLLKNNGIKKVYGLCIASD